jgi:hypothetical protein
MYFLKGALAKCALDVFAMERYRTLMCFKEVIRDQSMSHCLAICE